MSRLVVSIGSRLRKMPMVVLMVFLAWTGLLIVSAKLNIADYFSSVFGYERLPYNEVDPNMAYWVGALPQLIQMAFGVWAIERGHRLAGLITACAFVVDLYTDVTFKTYGLGITGAGYIMPTFLTLIVYTLGSEFLLVASLQNMREYGPDAWNAFREIFGGLMGHVLQAFGKGTRSTAKAAQAGANWVLGDAAPPSARPVSSFRDLEEATSVINDHPVRRGQGRDALEAQYPNMQGKKHRGDQGGGQRPQFGP